MITQGAPQKGIYGHTKNVGYAVFKICSHNKWGKGDGPSLP